MTPQPTPAGNNSGEHPDMNLDEGHLGGYIRGRQSATKTVFSFEHGDPATYFPELWQWAIDSLGIGSVFDVGSGEGHASRFFLDQGCRVLAVDGSMQAKRDSVVPEQHVQHDFNDGVFVPEETFDLVWCCEFVEHVEERYLKHFLPTLALGSTLMMTYASPGQPGHHHVNCQPESYWIEKLTGIGMHHEAELTRKARAIAATGHFAAHGLVFTR
jgi:SAM-dependent methyltransferase